MSKLTINTLILCLLWYYQPLTFSQDPYNKSDTNDLKSQEIFMTGGFSIGAKVGGNSYLYFSPFAGIKHKRVMLATGFSLSQYIQNSPYLKEERLGARVLTRYKVNKLIFISAEYEGLKHHVAIEDGFSKKWTNNFFMGIGTAIPVSDTALLTFEFQYLVDYEPGKSPYGHRQTLGRLGMIF